MGVQNMDEFKRRYMSSRQSFNKKIRYNNNNMYIDDRILINQILGYWSISRYQLEY